MRLPAPRGPIGEALIDSLREGRPIALPAPSLPSDPLADEDLQLSLYLLYELHYQSFDDVVGDREWDPELLELRRTLELPFLSAIEDAIPRAHAVSAEELPSLLFELAERPTAPSPSRFLGAHGTIEQFLEFVIHRSAYQLKEADPHSWVIPRLTGKPKSALLEVQYDEYGSGNPARMHSQLFADSMQALGLDSSYGFYCPLLPAPTLATVNLMSYFGLHRRWRGAIVGHLAMFEITSAEPNRRYAHALRRLGHQSATGFFDEHVEADSVHENLAAYDLAGGLAVQHPELSPDIVFGAEALLFLEGLWAGRVVEAWEAGESSLLQGPWDPVADPRAAAETR